MSPLQAKQFLTIVKHMNLTKAANELYITQSALSQSLSKLENELGIRLFYRDGNRLILSKEGNILLPDFEHLVSVHDHLIENAHALSDQGRGGVRIGYCGSVLRFAAFYMSDFIPEVEELNGRTELKMLYSDSETLLSMLLREQIDFAVSYPPLQHEKISSQSFSKERIVLAAPLNHPLSAYKRISVKELKGVPMMGSCTGTHFRDLCDKLLLAQGVTPIYEKEGNYQDLYSIIGDNAVNGSLVSLCPEDTFEESYRDAGYVKIRLDEKNMAVTTAISWLTERKLDLQYKDLLDHFIASYNKQKEYHARFTGMLSKNYRNTNPS